LASLAAAKNALPHIPIVKAAGATLFAEDGSTLHRCHFIVVGKYSRTRASGHSQSHCGTSTGIGACRVCRIYTPSGRKISGAFGGPFYHPTCRRNFYSDNGSTAVEVAVKMAVQYFHNQGDKRPVQLIALENAYHGDTFGAMSVSGYSAFNAPFQDMLFQVSYLPVPTNENFDAVCEKMFALLSADSPSVFIYEPLLQGVAGMRVYEAGPVANPIAISKSAWRLVYCR
jgi:hypothetical protein